MANPGDQWSSADAYVFAYGPRPRMLGEEKRKPTSETTENKDTSTVIALPQGSQIKARPRWAEKQVKRSGLWAAARKDSSLVDRFSKLRVAKEPHLSRRERRRGVMRAIAHQASLLAAHFAELHLPDNSTSTPEDTTTVAEISKATEATLIAERALAVLQNAIQTEKDEKADTVCGTQVD